MKDDTVVKTKWFQIWKRIFFGIKFELGGYFDPHPELHIGLLFFQYVFKFPIKTKYDGCESPYYGIYIYDHTLNIHFGEKTILYWEIPFISWVHMGRWIDVKDEGFVNSKVIEKERMTGEWPCATEYDKINKFTSPYVDSYDNTVVKATFWKEYRVWKRKWLTWLPFGERKREYIEIEFDKGVGHRKHSWKGGVTGTSYDLLPGEDPKTCLKRMENERQY